MAKKKSTLQEIFGLMFAVSFLTWLLIKPSKKSKGWSSLGIGPGPMLVLVLVAAIAANESTRVLGIILFVAYMIVYAVAKAQGKLDPKPPVASPTRRTGEVFYMPPLDKPKPALTAPTAPLRVDAPAAQTGANTLASGDPFEIVGEYFYAQNFETLRLALGAELDEERTELITLMNDPANPNSKNGAAVAVYCQGLKLGHISEQENRQFFDLLKTVGGVATCLGNIWFDDQPELDDRSNTVELLVAWPPRLANSK